MTKKQFIKIFKRFLLAFLCCLPIFVLIGIFLTDKIGNVWTVVIYVIIGAVAYILAEIIGKKHEAKMEERREKARLQRRYKHLDSAVKSGEEKKQTKTKKSNENEQTKD